MPRPFQYLKQNINKIKFDCDPQYVQEYKRAFSAVLSKMDNYFESNGLYNVVDYQPIVEQILASNKTFSFVIDEEIYKRNWAGVHRKTLDGNRIIGMNKEYMGQGTTTEGVLCHEFIHQLTLGPEVLTYKKDGDDYETQLPVRTGGFTLSGMKRNVTKRKVEALEAGSALDGGFICEAFTELVKQQIYSEQECYHSYPAQTSLIKLLNNLTGTQVNIEDFLRGDLPNYVQVLGRDNFAQFNKYCDEFQKKHNANASIDHTTDSDYLAAQDLICNTILKNIADNPEKYSTEDYVRIVSSIMAEAPALESNPDYCQEKYGSAIVNAGNQMALSRSLEYEEKKKFNQLLQRTIERSVQQKKDSFQMPSTSLDFAFKKTQNGFALNFKDGLFISNSIFPTHYSSKKVAKIGSNEISIEIDKKGTYQITAKAPNEDPQIIKIIPNGLNPNKLLIQDANTEDVFKLDFNRETKKRDRTIKENLTLLENFNQFDNIQTILKENANNKIVKVEKISAENGDEYLVANANKNSWFYKLTPNGYRRVDVIKQEPAPVDRDITCKVRTGKDEKTSMIGYLHTGVKTDEFSTSLKLVDGTTFVRYYDKTGTEQIGQQITPFHNSESTVIVEIDNQTLYNKNNEDIADLTSTSTTYALKGVKREISYRDLEAEQKAQEEQRRLNAEKQRKAQEERDKRLQETRSQQAISQEEEEKRQKRIEEERIRRRQSDEDKEKRFKEVEEKVRAQFEVEDEFGLKKNDIEEMKMHLEQSMGRGR